MNAQQLKNSILQEAIEGRLVPQDPNDEPASVLLDRIRKEKARLVKEGKLKKKDLEEKPISEDEIPFEIPENWEWVRFENIFNVRSAKRIHQSDWQHSGIPFFRGRELVQLIKTGDVNSEIFIKEELYESLKGYGIPAKDDILISAVGTIGRVYIVKGTKAFYYKDAYILCCENIGKINPQYTAMALTSPYLQKLIHQDSMATTVAQLTIEKAKSLVIPFPPLAEQKRIVAKIEELLPKVEAYGKAQESLDKLNEELPERLKKSILQEAIEGRLVPQDPNDEPASVLLDRIRKEKARLVKEGKLKKKDLEEIPVEEDEKPFEIPKSWEWVRIGNVYKTSSGGTPEKGHPEFYDGDIPWVKVGDLTSLYIDHTEDKITEEGLNSSSAKIFPADTILLAMYCNDAIGKSSILTKPMTTNQAICGLYPNPYLQKEYVYYAIQSNRSKLQEQSAGGAQKNINQKIVNDLIIPLPPFAEQKRIVAKIEQLLHEIDMLKK